MADKKKEKGISDNSSKKGNDKWVIDNRKPIPEQQVSDKSLVKFDPLQRYLAEVSRYRLLTRDEERELAMRVKEDVLASIYTQLWFTPTKLGTFHIFCAEYCGLQHSGMLGKLRVVEHRVGRDQRAVGIPEKLCIEIEIDADVRGIGSFVKLEVMLRCPRPGNDSDLPESVFPL